MSADRPGARIGIRWIVGAAATGLVLGVALRGLSAPFFGSSGGYFLLGVAAAVITFAVGMLTLAIVVARASSGGWARSRTPALAGAALITGLVAGYVATPPAPGSVMRSPGTGTAGTAQNRTLYWSGNLECVWIQGEASVEQVVGFDVQLSDALIEELHLEPGEISQKLIAVQLPRSLGGEAGIGIGFDREQYGGRGNALVLSKVSRAGASGEAVSASGVLAVTWTCSGGP
jgi:ABC-type amino acid transport substrate-binding protein